MTLIDLGEPGAGPDGRIRADPQGVRRAGVTLVAALTLLGCTGSIRPGQPGVRPLWSAVFQDGDGLELAGDTAYLLRGRDGADTELIVYDLATGAERWRWNTTDTVGFQQTRDDAGLLMLGLYPQDGTAVTVALRTDSGAEAWRISGDIVPADFADPGMLITEDGRLRLIDVADGRTLWTRTEASTDVVVGDHRVVTTDTRGDVTVLRYADAAVLTRRRIPALATDPAANRYVMLTAEQGLLLAYHDAGNGTVSSVYDLDSLEEVRAIDAGDGPLSGCGTVLCAFTRSGLAAYDPGTGRRLWSDPEANGWSGLSVDRILLDDDSGTAHTLVDSRTGRRLVENLRGRPVDDENAGSRVLLLRPITDLQDRVAVTRLDMVSGRHVTLGALAVTPALQRCRTVPGYLVCEGLGRLDVAAVPS
ncbi:PQQ-binding-like beta-propeller repeat protein [Actinoplanes sp. NBRC 101535]|uniref:outer membrane protein assembly factor BamB family protein n=1 Tax=Actinoplanes sp. NBRC 101535 TaxID=3032196 RepID=UPI0024A102F9|nr:PQQ-binding-like beta-propeller repeat protein [Actinoplanes sp. NBRC 101535]GLY03593.1 hypothetical protein Acsp01_39720 [Actinoplanes sp. NBRC 101535]